MNNTISAILSVIGGIAAFLFGPWDALIIALIVVVCIDYLSGVISAAVNQRLSSRTGFIGLLKKLFIFLVVALSAMLDRLVPVTKEAVRATVCMFYIVNESLSIIENAGEIGLPLPDALKKAISKLNKKDGDDK